MGLKEELLRGVFAYGLETPSAIQQKAIVPAAAGTDVLMHAQSGTGKTGAFAIGMLDRVDTSPHAGTQALILSPTRDLALQTQRVVLAIGNYLAATCHASIGGRSGRADGDALRQNPHVVTGTPGRVIDNIERGSLNVGSIKTLVLDEVDVLLEEGFVDAIQQVIRSLPRDCQIMAVSATYTPAVHDVCDKFLQNPVKIVIPQEEITLAGIKQFYVDTGSDECKLDVLLDLYETLNASQSVIFVNTRRRAVELAQQMDEADHTVSVIHGELEQAERDLRLREFVSGASRVLIATDIVARGIDAQQVSVVVNVDLPHDRANYIHRIGPCNQFATHRTVLTTNLLLTVRF
jgi:translation initiation factor 4A